MKRYLIFALLSLCLPLLIDAQTVDGSAQRYCVRYEKEHLFLQKDSDFNVVDYDLEWPEVVSYNAVVPLKRFISNAVFGYTTQSLDSALMNINNVYGKAVTGKFKTIPDDNRFCYVSLEAKVLSYSPDRWIAYSLKRKVEPQKLSSSKPEVMNRIIFYDLQNGRVMFADEMISKSVMNWSMPQDFYDRLFAPIADNFGSPDDDLFNNLKNLQINGVWIDGDKIFMYVEAASDVENVSYTVDFPYNDYRYVLTRDVRRLVEKDVKPRTPQFIQLPLTWKGDTIYNKVEKMPEFKGGEQGLQLYLSHVTQPNIALAKAVRVYVSFVVDKQGNICDVSVVSPVSPLLDEHAVGVIKGMPAFTPGSHNGKPVCVRMYLPINYKP